MKAISASGIKKYRSCPKQYWFRYLSEEAPKEGDERFSKLGSSVHDAIEARLNGDERDLFVLFAEEYDERFADRDGKMWDRGVGCMEVAERFLDGMDDEVLSVEDKITFEMSHFGGIECIAYMDVATDERVIDWKTGNRDPKEEAIQGAFYALAYKARFGEFPDRVEFVYLKLEEKHVMTSDSGAMEVMMKWLKGLMTSYDSDEWPAKPGDNCYWCGYEPFCEDSEAGWAGVSFSQLNPRWPTT